MKRRIIEVMSEILNKHKECQSLLEELNKLITINTWENGIDASDSIDANSIPGTVGMIIEKAHIRTEYQYKTVKLSLHVDKKDAGKVIIEKLIQELKGIDAQRIYRTRFNF